MSSLTLSDHAETRRVPMKQADDHQHLDVDHDGHVVCSADVTAESNAQPSVNVSLHSEAGHIPPGSRRRLVDEVLALPLMEHRTRLAATVPRGDSESLHRLQERCDNFTTHMAGATVIVDADFPSKDGTKPDETKPDEK
jgi:hypothetical protein